MFCREFLAIPLRMHFAAIPQTDDLVSKTADNRDPVLRVGSIQINYSNSHIAKLSLHNIYVKSNGKRFVSYFCIY